MKNEPSRERTFLAIYPALDRLRDAGDILACAVGNFLGYAESSDPGAREIGKHPAKAPSDGGDWFEPEATQLRQALNDEMLRDLPEELFRPMEEGLFLVDESIGLDDSSGLRRAEELLELGWESINAFISTTAAKVFGQWGGLFFGICVESNSASMKQLFDPAGYSLILLAKILDEPIVDADAAVTNELHRRERQKQSIQDRTIERQKKIRELYEQLSPEERVNNATAFGIIGPMVGVAPDTARKLFSKPVGND